MGLKGLGFGVWGFRGFGFGGLGFGTLGFIGIWGFRVWGLDGNSQVNPALEGVPVNYPMYSETIRCILG